MFASAMRLDRQTLGWTVEILETNLLPHFGAMLLGSQAKTKCTPCVAPCGRCLAYIGQTGLLLTHLRHRASEVNGDDAGDISPVTSDRE